ncbi:transcription factor TFIIIC subunit tfc4, partial [Linderina macrospora]
MDDSEYYTDYLDEEEDLDMLDEQNDSSYQLGSDASDDEVNQIDENVLKSAIAMASMATGSTELANNLTVNWNEQPADTEAGSASDDSENSEPQPNQPRMTSRLRSTSKQPTTYDVKKLGPELEDSVEHEAFLTDDDEDSNYEDEEEDDLFGDMDELKDTLRGISGIGRSKKKTKRGRGRPVNQHKLKPEAQRLMGMANTLFVDRKLDDAYEILCEVIRMDANAQEAWYTMALIRDEQGRPDDSVHLYTLAAHLQPSNYELWERLSTMHCEAAERKEHAGKSGDEDWQAALYCISNAIKNGPRHVPILKRKLALQERV